MNVPRWPPPCFAARERLSRKVMPVSTHKLLIQLIALAGLIGFSAAVAVQPPLRTPSPQYAGPGRAPGGRGALPPPLPGGTLPPAVDSSYGALSIRVQPAGAMVFIDGERWEGPDAQERLVVSVSEGR